MTRPSGMPGGTRAGMLAWECVRTDSEGAHARRGTVEHATLPNDAARPPPVVMTIGFHASAGAV